MTPFGGGVHLVGSPSCEALAFGASATCGVLLFASCLAVAFRKVFLCRLSDSRMRLAGLRDRDIAVATKLRVAREAFDDEVDAAHRSAEDAIGRCRLLLARQDTLNAEKVRLWSTNEDLERAVEQLHSEDAETLAILEERRGQLRSDCTELEEAAETLADECEAAKAELKELHLKHMQFVEEVRARFARASGAADSRLENEDDKIADLRAELEAASQRSDFLCARVSEYWTDTMDVLTCRFLENAETIKDFVALVEAMENPSALLQHAEQARALLRGAEEDARRVDRLLSGSSQ